MLKPSTEMQIDLMVPLEVDSMVQDGRAVRFRRDGNAFFATLAAPQRAGEHKTITVYYHGKPRVATNPPWQGGFTWTSDSLGRPWVVTTDQGMGASVWWPNKDTQADEPDSQRVALTVARPDDGRVERAAAQHHAQRRTAPRRTSGSSRQPDQQLRDRRRRRHVRALQRRVTTASSGKLTLDFWPLDYHLAAAHRQFPQARSMLQCFEHWFGPYPWYEDGYKLLEVPNTGMEHQSAVSYGNWYQNGYRKRDGSGTGLGLQWDFIIVHESAHEWFGNNITAKDKADMWVHESFANYAEGLYTECLFGKDAGGAVHHRQPPRHAERSSDHPAVRRQRSGLRRHVPQGRRDAAHHPPDRRRRREVARHPARASTRPSGTRP